MYMFLQYMVDFHRQQHKAMENKKGMWKLGPEIIILTLTFTHP